ncbi:SDR family NAD(P)-dependent oxidoreductase [Marivirga sp. S37H4]|uniref:SDR family NAD(P)-dependent oxidoreductase n=1 Tax=Marivirga aurantiaca TaxID=2802615 RepID=A0A934WY47_9BACT|nr:SDR family NAD(P)-dependent oxidoreductase [Marivirga aurantiaca]MBK6264975.1 SDR family NAD(P)-dependent oxidoreductase [Marivirga aurantiaca]
MEKINGKHNTPPIGIVEWFRPGQYDEVKQVIKDLKKLGIKHIRTGISWADWHVDGSPQWYDWLVPELAKHVEILPCFLYTPPSLGEAERSSAPPRNLKSFADFIDVMITRYGEYFDWVELWNEPNNVVEYDFTLDYSWNKFAQMIDMAAYWAKHRGKKTLLGGMSPIDPNWLQSMTEKGVLEHIDAIGIHGFPDVFDQQWNGWEENIQSVREVLGRNNLKKEIWISEAGFSTWQDDEVKQLEEFKKVISCKADRVYWYRLNDLDSQYATVGGFHLDEREYFFGMKKQDGTEKLLFKLLAKEGVKNIHHHTYINKQYNIKEDEKYILITGGAGFIGTNLAARLLSEGKKVMVYDNISRAGVEQNLQWLQKEYGDKLIVQVADIKEGRVLEACVKNAEQVFHFSAQVAVTSSLTNPSHDFEVNIVGTFNLLEAIRKSSHKPPLVFTSTNKVYGNLLDLGLETDKTRYFPTDSFYKKNGIDENRSLDFQSPYGCSKGTADQYVLDYSRSYGLETAVFRMSCIYGPHQFGNENQGWVAHFLIRALENKPIVIYGNGKQVRDILFVEDLVDAFILAQRNIKTLAGNAFNIGGGPENSVSLMEILDIIQEKTGRKMDISFEKWRTGDQQYYVSNISKFQKATGWKPQYTINEGVQILINWLCETRNITLTEKKVVSKAMAV